MHAPLPAKPLPVYLQVAELLARQIKAGYWHSGERLPTEAELAQTLSVAVGTLRKSLALLEAQGVLERIQGSGTYVRQIHHSQQIYELFRLELMEGPGLPTAHILDVTLQQAPIDLLGKDQQSAPCWRVRRMRFLNQKPAALEEIWFSARHCLDLDVQDLGDSMYLFYQQRLNIWIARVEDQISVAAAPSWSVPPIGLLANQSAGYIERLSWTANNEIAEFSKTWFDPQVCRYTSRMSQ
ncbi:GntR family transcriptional regulator [Limnohabitans sp. DCL3]|uniref:GntR family transcriptional regulator n=1 Tax=Limnohabitans sp. DCL3 TaxID=3374103 RepID=UPI003A856968